MEAWWAALATPAQVFYGIAFISTIVLLLQAALMMLGFGDGDMEVDGVDGHDSGLGWLSIRSIMAFFTGFGWGGAIAHSQGLGLMASLVVAFLAGGTLMITVVVMMRVIYGLGEEGTLDYANAIGESGSVYLPIPAAMAGPGQVEVRVQGRLRTVRAFTRGEERLENRRPITVTEVLDPQTLVVAPLDLSPREAESSNAATEGGTNA